MTAPSDRYNAEIAAAIAAAGHRVAVPVVKAVIEAESGWNPRAYRAEPKINDASRGLMQLLLGTARGLGFDGSSEDLYDPAENIRLGVLYLSRLVTQHSGDVAAALSAYNNGHGRRATKPTTTCLARDTRGVCIRSFTAAPGEFLNQPYVDKVLGIVPKYGGGAPPAGGGLGVLVVLAGAAWWWWKYKANGAA